MKKNILIALIAAAGIAPFAAHAEAYVGVNAGRTQQKLSSDGIGSVKDHSTAYQVNGGYQITPMFGVEVGYSDLGEATIRSGADFVTASPSGAYVAATGNFKLSQEFSLIAKAGVTRMNTDIITNGPSAPTMHHTSMMVGFGATYAITPAVLAVVEYQNFGKVIKEDGGSLKAQALTVGVRMKF